MKFREGDELVSCGVFSGETEFLVVTSEGFGKRVDPEQFTRKKRSGLGVRGIGVNEKKGHVIGAMFVAPEDEIMLISDAGVIIRTTVGDISVQGRDATGVTVMSLGEGEQVSALARLFTVDEEELDDVAGGGDGEMASADLGGPAAVEESSNGAAAGDPEANGSAGESDSDDGSNGSADDQPD
jgi:DNA gyrase subunit A